MQCFGGTQGLTEDSTIVNVCGSHCGIPHPPPNPPCCIPRSASPSSQRQGYETELSLLPSLLGKNVTHVGALPCTQMRVGCVPGLSCSQVAGRGRRQGAQGRLLWWSLPRADPLQAVALLTVRGSPVSVLSHLRAACCGMHERPRKAAALCHWKWRRT